MSQNDLVLPYSASLYHCITVSLHSSLLTLKLLFCFNNFLLLHYIIPCLDSTIVFRCWSVTASFMFTLKIYHVVSFVFIDIIFMSWWSSFRSFPVSHVTLYPCLCPSVRPSVHRPSVLFLMFFALFMWFRTNLLLSVCQSSTLSKPSPRSFRLNFGHSMKRKSVSGLRHSTTPLWDKTRSFLDIKSLFH